MPVALKPVMMLDELVVYEELLLLWSLMNMPYWPLAHEPEVLVMAICDLVQPIFEEMP